MNIVTIILKLPFILIGLIFDFFSSTYSMNKTPANVSKLKKAINVFSTLVLAIGLIVTGQAIQLANSTTEIAKRDAYIWADHRENGQVILNSYLETCSYKILTSEFEFDVNAKAISQKECAKNSNTEGVYVAIQQSNQAMYKTASWPLSLMF